MNRADKDGGSAPIPMSPTPPQFEPVRMGADAATFVPSGCKDCRNREPLDIGITMAFQPIVQASTRSIYGYEALVRGVGQEPAGVVLSKVTQDKVYSFDQTCRVVAIDLAARLGLQGMLSINFLPNAVYRPETCIRATLEAAEESGFPTDRLMFEVTESERIVDSAHLKSIFQEYKRRGFTVAIDDFGAGYSGLNLLAEFQPDVIKLDMALTRGFDSDRVRQAIVAGILRVCESLSIRVVAEGIETREEYEALRGEGVDFFQGYHFARPGFQMLPAVEETAW